MKDFFKRNRFFVTLLLIFGFIIIGLLSYTLFNKMSTTKKEPDINDIEDNVKTPVIDQFVGEFDSKNQQCSFNWNIALNSSSMKSAALWHNDTQISDVSNYQVYSLPQLVFNFPSGQNTFTLKVELDDGKTLSKSVNVFIPIITSKKQDVIWNDNGLDVTFTYTFSQNTTISVPSIKTFGEGSSQFDVTYLNTTYEDKEGLTTAKTTFRFSSTEAKSAWKDFVMRWVFNELELTYDYNISMKKA